MNPVIIYFATGIEHIVYCIWSVRSLKALNYEPIEILVSQSWEKQFIQKHLEGVSCEIVKADREGYGMWALRPFTLQRYEIKHRNRDVVICDTDILWKKDPAQLFRRFKGQPWVHKITSLNPSDLDMDINRVPQSRIGLQTMINYKEERGLKTYLNFHLNCGLFMLPRYLYLDVLEDWARKIRNLRPQKMIMTEALLSLVYAEMGISPICDRNDIKHVSIQHDIIHNPLVPFRIAELPKGMSTGYETAQHYYGDQRNLLYKNVLAMGLDYDNLLSIVKRNIIVKNIKRLPKLGVKVIHAFEKFKRVII